jgi:tagatose-1,6-bisphosphate aldolase
MTTLGKYRHLAQCSTPAGHFTILALDHRGNLRDSLNQHAPKPLTDDEFTAFKQHVMRRLLAEASAVLTDPEHGFGPGIASGVIGGQVGLLSPLEVTDYSLHPSRRLTNFIPNWNIAKIKRVGGSGVKLLLYYHPDADIAPQKRDLVQSLVLECQAHDIPFFLEPIAYSLNPRKPLTNAEWRKAAVKTAGTFSQMGVDVLKLEFPLDVKQESNESVWQEAVEELNAACSVPWALLSAGVDYPTFRRQAEIACKAGASGVIVGRAVWAEAVELQGDARDRFLATTARQRMKELADICARLAKSWRDKAPPPDVEPGWYAKYGTALDAGGMA